MQYNFRSSNLCFLTLFLIIGCQTQTALNDIQPGTPEHKGQEVFNRMACNACHSVDGSLKLGPTIKSQYGKNILHTDGSIVIIDDQYIRESLVDPLKYIAEGYTPIMPSYKPVLSDEDIENLIAFMKAIK